MIPVKTMNMDVDDYGLLPSKNYKMVLAEEVVRGSTDELAAMQQVVFKILNTQRYENIIYSWNYGIELEDLFGEPVTFVCAELERRIKEALIQDDRIESVDSFVFDTTKKRTVAVSFAVNTIFGDVEATKEVKY